MKRSILFIFFISIFSCSFSQINYTLPETPWEEKFGNHRAVVQVDKPSDAVSINFLWRRHDESPEKRRMLVICSQTGDEVENIFRAEISNERCTLVFGPAKKAGTYYFYYLPYNPVTKEYHSGDYLLPEDAPDEAWAKRHKLSLAHHAWKDVTKAVVSEIQARTEFHSFYPMEVAATKDEVAGFLLKHREDYLLFPEDRAYPIRMKDALPLRWVQKMPGKDFHGTAARNEYYAFQIGVFAPHEKIENLRLEFSGLKDKQGNLIPSDALTCFNTNGIDTWGKPFTKVVDVEQGKVQPLWVGIDIPGDAAPGLYQGTVTVKTDNIGEQKVKLLLTVEDKFLADRGDGETWRHSRLRWLNSTLGIDDEPVNPYTALEVDGPTISCLGRSVSLNSYGLPEKVNTWGNDILSAPIGFVIEMNNQKMAFPATKFKFKEQKNGIVSWKSVYENNILKIECQGEMEFDGRLSYHYNVSAKTNIHIQDIRLELPFRKEFASYMVGMGASWAVLHRTTHLSRWTKNRRQLLAW